MGRGPAQRAFVSAEVVRRAAQVGSGAGVAAGGSVFLELGGDAVQAARGCGITERSLVGGAGVICGGGPEAGRGNPAVPLGPAVLVEVICEPAQLPVRGAGLAVSQLLIAVPGSGSGCAGSGRTGPDAAERPADAFGGLGGVGQGLFQPVVVLGVPLVVCQVEPPRVFRTGNLRLVHAASCPFRYSSRTSCGVRYPSVEWRRVLL